MTGVVDGEFDDGMSIIDADGESDDDGMSIIDADGESVVDRWWAHDGRDQFVED